MLVKATRKNRSPKKLQRKVVINLLLIKVGVINLNLNNKKAKMNNKKNLKYKGGKERVAKGKLKRDPDEKLFKSWKN
jgi:hypothetical protein